MAMDPAQDLLTIRPDLCRQPTLNRQSLSDSTQPSLFD
jgi:hypothetical protein